LHAMYHDAIDLRLVQNNLLPQSNASASGIENTE